MYFVSPLVFIFLLSACCIFSEFLHEMNASLGLCKAARLSVRILLVLENVNAVGLSRNVDSRFEFCPRSIWKGENPWTFGSEFLAFRRQDKARSRLNCNLSSDLSIISAIMILCLSTKSLLNGDSAVVTLTVMFMASHISKNSALASSPPLSVKNIFGVPKIWIQLLNIALMIMLGSLDGAKVDADNLVVWSIRWSFFCFDGFALVHNFGGFPCCRFQLFA